MAQIDKLTIQIKTEGVEKAKQEILELQEIVFELKKLGLKKKTINQIVKTFFKCKDDE